MMQCAYLSVPRAYQPPDTLSILGNEALTDIPSEEYPVLIAMGTAQLNCIEECSKLPLGPLQILREA
jgi:hypothetical protein